MPSPKALIFDMDGTLVDNMSYHKQSWIDLFAHHQIDLDYDTFDKKYHKGSLVEIMKRIFPEIENEKELFRIGSYKEVLYRDLYRPHVKAIEGLHAFLKKHQTLGFPMGIATMGDQHNIDFIFNTIELTSFFHSTTGGHQIKNGKPHPEIFLKAAKKLQVAPKDCLVFEDTKSGIAAALAAGMQVIGISTMFDKKTLLEHGCVAAVSDYTNLNLIEQTLNTN
jgi:beta-phosphoglucomutase family hydrolase